MLPSVRPGPRSLAEHERARQVTPGGVNSPARAFAKVGGGPPVVLREGRGSRVWDVDGYSYVDYLAGYGPLILGHAHPRVVEAVSRAAAQGPLLGTSTPGETELAERLQAAVPSMQLIRLLTTGTEAVMTALRLARGHTGRSRVVKFDGAYHGHSDPVLVRAGSGAASVGVPDSAGVTPATAAEVTSLPHNDLGAVKGFFDRCGDEVAAVLVEPVAGNMGLVDPEPGFLEGLRHLTAASGAVLIFDEVITGFRFHFGAVQDLLGVRPDLTCLGKIIGGGLPLAAVGGRREIMSGLAPEGRTYQAGTHAGNPLGVAAGLATLAALETAGVYEGLEEVASALAAGLKEAAARAGIPVTINRRGSMFTLFFGEGRVRDRSSVEAGDHRRFARFFRLLLERGVLLAPSPYECWFVSTAHGWEDVELTLAAAEAALARLSGKGEE